MLCISPRRALGRLAPAARFFLARAAATRHKVLAFGGCNGFAGFLEEVVGTGKRMRPEGAALPLSPRRGHLWILPGGERDGDGGRGRREWDGS